jgi:hypothetical protein
MDNRRQDHGQTLVELALVLPCFCLGVFMAVQLLTYCHNMVEIQRMAQVALHRITIETYRDAYKHYWFNSLYGNVTLPHDSFSSQSPHPWRKFIGASTVDDSGLLVTVHVASDLLPTNGFRRVLSRVTQAAEAVALLEPPIQGDH